MVILLQGQINIILSILLSILLGHAYFNMNRKKLINRLAIWIIELTIITLILEIFSVLLNNSDLKQFMVLHKLVNIIGFIVAPSILFLAYIFSREWVNRYQKEKIKVNKILLLPLFINGIAAFISYNGSGIFHVTSDNLYERGTLFFIVPLVTYIYFGYNLYFIYKQRKKLTHWEFIIFTSFYIIPAVFSSIQFKNIDYFTTWISVAIVIVISYIFILNDQAYRDTLTGLENRLSYENYAQNRYFKKINKLHIVYIDIDEFKSINDQYGHCEGDEAIKTFSNLLRESFSLRQKKLIRLGGDEFLIILEEQHPEKALAYIQKLSKNVEDYNNKGEKPYRLRFSYGMACNTDPCENMCELLERADKMMYKQKESRKSNL